MSADFSIAETEAFHKQLRKSPQLRRVYEKISTYVYPILRKNPFVGPNIKRLGGNLSEFYRFRIGDYRLFYTVDQRQVMVFIIRIEHRKEAYR